MTNGEPPDASRKNVANGNQGLARFFDGKQLTPSQVQAVTELQLFLDDASARCFVLRGYAGTGKTFLIGGLVRYLEAQRRNPVMMAPTGRAAYVLRDRHRVDAGTIHRSIYSLEKLREHREVGEDGDVTFKFYFETKNNGIEHDTVFIVDEASMISDVASDPEFLRFGSGRLLHDLLSFINFDANDYRKKLILVGDGAQLPPVHMNTSPALDRDYLASQCRLDARECELVDVVRQLDSSLVLRNATEMRRMLKADRYAAFDFKSDNETVIELKPSDFVERFARTYERSSLQARSVIVAYTNADVANYNAAVRAILSPGQATITAGDRIVVVRNNYNYERPLLNGQMGLVVEASAHLETRSVPVNVGLGEDGKRKTELVILRFRDLVLKFEGDDRVEFELRCKIIEDCLDQRSAELPSSYSKALWVDFRQRHPDLDPGDAVFSATIRADPYFTALQVKYGYAVTCHKAQGGEWDTVFIDFAGMNKLGRSEFRWSYTALTRASRSVVATNALHHSLLTPKQPVVISTESSPVTVSNTPVTNEDSALNSAGLAAPPVGLVQTPLQGALWRAVQSRLPEGWKLNAVKHVQFQECYTVEKATYVATARIYYNGANKVSNVQLVPGQKADLDDELHTALASLKGNTIHAGGYSEGMIEPGHVAFIAALKEKGEAAGVVAVRFESKTKYHLVGTFREGSQEGSFDYYFDQAGRFSRVHAHASGRPELTTRVLNLHAQ